MQLEQDEQRRTLLNRIKKENIAFPQTILIDNISYCNLRCSMCPHRFMTRKKGKMSWELYKKIVDEIAEKNLDVRMWITFFGEGLMFVDLPQRVRYAKEKGLHDVVLNSNGNLLNYNIASELVKAGLDAIYVGIDAFKKETYEKIRVGGNLDKVVNGVLDYKKALDNYGNSSQKVFVQYVEMEENKDELPEFLRFWKDKSVQVKVRPKVSWAGKVEANNLKEFPERLPCFWAMNTINIIDDGTVCLCSVDLECQVPMGDINYQTIEEVWNGKLKEFRQNQLNGRWDILPIMCRNCKDWQSGYSEYF